MEAQGVTTLSEALRNVPGITLQAGEGGGASSTAGDMFNMRGFNASNSLFVDNVRDDGLVSQGCLQPRTGRSVHGADRLGRRPRHRRRLREHADQDAASAARRLGHAHLRDRQSAPRHARRQPAALLRQSRQLDRQVGGPPERAVAGQRRRRPRRSGERDARRSRRRSASASAPPPASSPPRRSCASDNLPDYGIPGAAWQESLLAPTTVHADESGRSEQLLRQPGVRLRPRRPEHGHRARRAQPRRRAGRCPIRPATTGPSAKRSSARCRSVASFVAGDRTGDGRPSGQRAREHDHLEPDHAVGTLHDRTRGAQHQLRPRVRPRSAVRADADRRRHPRAGQHLQPESERSGHRLRGLADRRVHRRPDRHRRDLRLRLGVARHPGAGERRPAVRALRHRVPLGRCRERDDRRTRRARMGS